MYSEEFKRINIKQVQTIKVFFSNQAKHQQTSSRLKFKKIKKSIILLEFWFVFPKFSGIA